MKNNFKTIRNLTDSYCDYVSGIISEQQFDEVRGHYENYQEHKRQKRQRWKDFLLSILTIPCGIGKKKLKTIE